MLPNGDTITWDATGTRTSRVDHARRFSAEVFTYAEDGSYTVAVTDATALLVRTEYHRADGTFEHVHYLDGHNDYYDDAGTLLNSLSRRWTAASNTEMPRVTSSASTASTAATASLRGLGTAVTQ